MDGKESQVTETGEAKVVEVEGSQHLSSIRHAGHFPTWQSDQVPHHQFVERVREVADNGHHQQWPDLPLVPGDLV